MPDWFVMLLGPAVGIVIAWCLFCGGLGVFLIFDGWREERDRKRWLEEQRRKPKEIR